jgi:hypothetical protein
LFDRSIVTGIYVTVLHCRMRKKDEGSYALDEPRRSPNVHLYSKAPTREFFA